MLACLYNGSAHSFTCIPATLKAKFVREFGSQHHLACVPPAPAIVWPGKDRISMTKVESVAWFYGTCEGCASVRLRCSGPVWCHKVVLAPKNADVLCSSICSLCHFSLISHRHFFKLKIFYICQNCTCLSSWFSLKCISFIIALFASLNRLCQMREMFIFIFCISQTVYKCISLCICFYLTHFF